MALEQPDQVRPYLDEIADRLWSGNAAVMVGAGFSRNVKPVGAELKTFPDWHELGDMFFQKLHGHPPNDDRYLNLLELAELVKAAYGRPTLDNMLLQAIPDKACDPSPLHSQLLNLPWQDVFTTNYDTLLERARATVALKHYSVVTKKEDLLYANVPRIVKLHGTFPSPPYVITEEDYRRYPSDHAPFVNTVRQSLLENTLCLIGFSGDDPNFLQWIGWIRDHVGKDASAKMYLVGVFKKLTRAKRSLLHDRGIVVLDLPKFDKDHEDEDHEKALYEFLRYLKSKKPVARDWPNAAKDTPIYQIGAGPGEFAQIVAEWRRQRAEFPGWVVVPEDRRRHLWQDTERWRSRLSYMSPEDRAGLDTPLDLDLASELAWRLERCRSPLIGGLSQFFEDVAAKYSDTTLDFSDGTSWTRASVFDAVANIRLSLLRHYREQGQEKKWSAVSEALESDFARLPSENQAKFRLEEVLQALFRLDPFKAKRLLANWQANEDLPFWEAKRAALMAELGDEKTAHSILKTSLAAIRQDLSLNPVIGDYTLISQESVVMLLLWAVERGKEASRRAADLGVIFTGERDETTKAPDADDGNIFDELSERWNELAQYKCNVPHEMELLSARLRHPSVRWNPESETQGFDLGRAHTTFDGRGDTEAVLAFALLRMYEDIGMPYRVKGTTFAKSDVESTTPRLCHYAPHWALTNIVRLGNPESVDTLFDREYLTSLTSEDVDQLLEIYLPALERTIKNISESESSNAGSFEPLAKTLPEVISRLCNKCSPSYRERLMPALRAICGSRQRRWKFANVAEFADRLFHSMSGEEIARSVPFLIDFPVLYHDSIYGMFADNFNADWQVINPIRAIRFVSVPSDAIEVTEKKIDELLDRLDQNPIERSWTTTSLACLHELGKLNKRQSERFGEALWEGVQSPQVPLVPGYYRFESVNLPHPDEIDPKSRVKEHLQSIINEETSFRHLPNALVELRKSGDELSWSRTEAFELLAVLVAWWNTNKHGLPDPKQSHARSSDHVKSTITSVVHALSAVFSHIPPDQNSDSEVEAQKEFLEDLQNWNVPAQELEAATLNILPENRARVLDNVAKAMPSNQVDVVVDALWAAAVLARILNEQEARDDFAAIGAALAEGVQWRHRPALERRLSVVEELVKRQPWFLSKQIVSDLLAGLLEIAKQTPANVTGNDPDGVIAVRALAASLAFSLSEYYKSIGREEPEEIRHWREICSDPDEFSEVRNSWRHSGV